MTDPRIEALHLVGFAKRGAYRLLEQFPQIVFTSGRRNPSEQANAMAGNIVSSRNRQWILETYKDTPIRLACQRWVNANPQAKTKGQLAAGLLSVFAQIGDEELSRLSMHFHGLAFDVRPRCVPLAQLDPFVKALPGYQKFLTEEGGQERWHIQFVAEPATLIAATDTARPPAA